LFGDIIGIKNTANELVASYTYNAWGECTIGTNVDGVATLNPFRYRGYYYDTETGFYYLQTRYYDPEICRFISADDPEILGDLASVVGQLNLYAYCLNNPVMFTDPSGCITLDTIFDVMGLIWSFIDFIDTPSWENLGWVVLDLVCLAVPILTGSYAIKATAKGAQYVGGFVDYGKTTVKAVNYASDAAEVIAKADDKVDDFVDIYRAIGIDEYYSIRNTGIFSMGPGCEAKYFGLNLDDTIAFSNWATDTVSIVKTSVPMSFVKKTAFNVDSRIFRQGSMVVDRTLIVELNKVMTKITYVL